MASETQVETPPLRNDLLQTLPDPENNLLFLKNVSIPLKNSPLPIRANVYLPLSPSQEQKKYPVLVTYGPYGKDIPYATFHPASFARFSTSTLRSFNDRDSVSSSGRTVARYCAIDPVGSTGVVVVVVGVSTAFSSSAPSTAATLPSISLPPITACQKATFT